VGDGSFGFGRPPPLPSDAIPVGTASGLVATLPPRRERRFMYVLAAAAVVLGLGAVAVVSVQPATLVRTSALQPESSRSLDSAEPALDDRVVGSTQPASGTTELAAAGAAVDDLGRSGAARSAPERSGLEQALPDRPAANAVGPAALAERPIARGLGSRAPSATLEAGTGISEQEKLRVSEALTQPAKPQVAPPVAKKGPKRQAVARRAKPGGPAATAAAKPSTKVDCRQPFWIDEGGIRRLKMSCL
jgi:hypothetical protein